MCRSRHVKPNRPGSRSPVTPRAPRIGRSGRQRFYPAKRLVGRIPGCGIQPVPVFYVRHLFKEPVLMVITLADGIGNVVGKQQGITEVPTPAPVVCAIPFEKLAGTAIGIADLPDRLAIAHWLPFKLAQVEGLTSLNRDVSPGEFTEHPVRKGMQRIGTGIDVDDGE